MKKALAILAALVLLISCAAAETAAEPQTASWQLETKSYPWYMMSKERKLDGDLAIPLWFVNGAADLPFVDLNDWAAFMTFIGTNSGTVPGYELKPTVSDDGTMVILTRDNGYSACFDFLSGTLLFDDYIAFNGLANLPYVDITNFSAISKDQPFLLSMTGSRDRYGQITLLPLAEYEIPMIAQNGKYLIPLQTLSAFFFSQDQFSLYFNGREVFFTSPGSMSNPADTLERQLSDSGLQQQIEAPLAAYDGPEDGRWEYLLELVEKASEEGAGYVAQYRNSVETGLYAVYASVPAALRSEALIQYGYNELCLELDCLYGLKESHDISSFDMFFRQTDLSLRLLNPDAETADKAVADLTEYWFDDGHSGLLSASCYAGSGPEHSYGYNSQSMLSLIRSTAAIRKQYPNASLPYYEVGDTAYVTFDEFSIAPIPSALGCPDYYELAPKGELPTDTIGIIIDAHRRITRENSPIKNVVLDLSMNGGGLASTAVYTICWFLGQGRVSQHNIFTGAQSTMIYQADINLDRVFDEQDTLAGRGLNLYCLISPNSFSCGNLVPWAFKENGSVTLLGRVSGGGSCIVQPLTTAWGTSYQISGPKRLAFVKNGSYYDVDRGVEPDHIIDSYAHFFDREALTEFIHGLY